MVGKPQPPPRAGPPSLAPPPGVGQRPQPPQPASAVPPQARVPPSALGVVAPHHLQYPLLMRARPPGTLLLISLLKYHSQAVVCNREWSRQVMPSRPRPPSQSHKHLRCPLPLDPYHLLVAAAAALMLLRLLLRQSLIVV